MFSPSYLLEYNYVLQKKIKKKINSKTNRKSVVRAKPWKKTSRAALLLGGDTLPLGGSVTSILSSLSLLHYSFFFIFFLLLPHSFYSSFYLYFLSLTSILSYRSCLIPASNTTHTGKFYRCPARRRMFNVESQRARSTVRSTRDATKTRPKKRFLTSYITTKLMPNRWAS